MVKYPVERCLNSKKADCCGHVTLLQLAILSNNQVDAESLLESCLAEIRESWEPETIAKNNQPCLQKMKSENNENKWIRYLE